MFVPFNMYLAFVRHFDIPISLSDILRGKGCDKVVFVYAPVFALRMMCCVNVDLLYI